MFCTNIQKFGKIFLLLLLFRKYNTLFKNDSKGTYVTKKMFTEHEISILEWFMEDIVTLKTG